MAPMVPRNRNPGTRIGRPPKMRSTVAEATPRGQAPSPMASFDSATPAAAFKRGGSTYGCKPMPSHHDDPSFCSGGPTRRR